MSSVDQSASQIGLLTVKEGWQIIASVTQLAKSSEEEEDKFHINRSDEKSRLGQFPLVAKVEALVLDSIVHTEHNPLGGEPLQKILEVKSGLIFSEKITLYWLHTLLYRRGYIFIYLQYCSQTKIVRVVAYGTDTIHHSATSFWTSPLTNVSIDELTTKIKEQILPLLKDDKNYSKIPSSIRKRVLDGNYLFFV